MVNLTWVILPSKNRSRAVKALNPLGLKGLRVRILFVSGGGPHDAQNPPQ